MAATTSPQSRRMFGIGSMRFKLPRNFKAVAECFFSSVVDGAIYIIGPILICFALVIAYGLTYSFFHIMVPMLQRAWSDSPFYHIVLGLHITYVVFILFNVLFNYFMCVTTSNKGAVYQKVVRELAEATGGFVYPETPEEVNRYKTDYEDRMILRMERRRARRAVPHEAGSTPPPQAAASTPQQQTTSNTTTGVTQRRGGADPPQARKKPPARVWMLMGPHEWGFCPYSNQPKPPRAHYDSVMKTLVLNMDHYCPWMFNSIGYLNYRYFLNFLLYVFLGMLYGAVVAFRPFRALHSPNFSAQIREQALHKLQEVPRIYLWTPTPKEQLPIAFSFMLCLSVGIAVLTLLSFHAYLLLTAQTTIEFHGNYSSKNRARTRGTTWVNPYDAGRQENWRLIYGPGHPLLALLPSSREPQFLPFPIDGKLRRRQFQSKQDDDGDGIV